MDKIRSVFVVLLQIKQMEGKNIKKKVQTFSQTQIFTFTKGDKIPGMRGCYSGGITAMSTNGPISVSMQALKIPQISQGLPNKITDSLNISEVWLQFKTFNFFCYFGNL